MGSTFIIEIKINNNLNTFRNHEKIKIFRNGTFFGLNRIEHLEFKMKGMEYSANFLEDGTWKETEHEIKQNAIPATIKTVLDTQFSGYKIEESEISETKEGFLYEFELEKGEQMMEVAIDKNGKVVKKEMMNENKKEDKD